MSGCFFALGVDGAQEVLGRFTYEYLEVFGERATRAMADTVAVSTTDGLREAIDDADAAGLDEFILVPATTDPRCLEAATQAVSA